MGYEMDFETRNGVIGLGDSGRSQWTGEWRRHVWKMLRGPKPTSAFRYQIAEPRLPIDMNVSAPRSPSHLVQHPAPLRRRQPTMTLEDIVGAGACEACRGRITKVRRTDMLAIHGLMHAAHAIHAVHADMYASAPLSVRNAHSAASARRHATIWSCLRSGPRLSSAARTNRCCHSVPWTMGLSKSSICWPPSPWTLLTRS